MLPGGAVPRKSDVTSFTQSRAGGWRDRNAYTPNGVVTAPVVAVSAGRLDLSAQQHRVVSDVRLLWSYINSKLRATKLIETKKGQN
jgi:hypothetical protein